MVHEIVVWWYRYYYNKIVTLVADKGKRSGSGRRAARRWGRRALSLGCGRVVGARLRHRSGRERREHLLLLRRRRLLDDCLLPLLRGSNTLRCGEVRLGRARLLGGDGYRRCKLFVLDERRKVLHVALHPHVEDPVPLSRLGRGFIVDEHGPDRGRLAVSDRRVRARLKRFGHLLHYPLHTRNRERRPSHNEEINLAFPLALAPRAPQIAANDRSDQLSFGVLLAIKNDVGTQGSDSPLSLGQSRADRRRQITCRAWNRRRWKREVVVDRHMSRAQGATQLAEESVQRDAPGCRRE